MTIIRHELKQHRISLIVWTAAVGFLLAVCILIFPEMKEEMDDVSDMFASMGSFTEAFGMDKVSFGTLTGFYAVECGNILGLGGAFFAALCGVSILSKEEKEHTAEFLLTHPVSRAHIVTDKFFSVLIQVLALNAAVYAVSIGSIALIGEEVPWKELSLLHLAYLLLQVETAGICFGISAFLRHGSIGIGLGVAAVLYFLNLIANISDSAEFLRYITPFGYAEASDIVTNVSLDGGLIALGMTYGAIGIGAAYVKYCGKDIG